MSMIIAATVCMLVACIALAVGLCFAKKNRLLFLLLSNAALVALACLGVCCMALAKNFSLGGIFIVLCIVPLFLKVNFPTEEMPQEKPTNPANNLPENSQADAENNSNTSKFGKKLQKFGNLAASASYFASTLFLALCGLVYGKESAFGILTGVAIGLMLTFLHLLIKKEYVGKTAKENVSLYLEKFLHFVSIGLLLSSIVVVFLYSTSLSNIFFSLGALAYATHIFLQVYLKNNFNHLAHLAAMLLLFASILF